MIYKRAIVQTQGVTDKEREAETTFVDRFLRHELVDLCHYLLGDSCLVVFRKLVV